MIRLFTALCNRILDNLCDMELFSEATGGFRHYNKRCPQCRAAGKLAPHGYYGRGLVSLADGKPADCRIRPPRFRCSSCGATHALLPDIVVPYSPYSLRFKLAILAAYFKRDATVVAICERFGIAVSTLYRWKKRLLEHKGLILGALADQKEPALAFLRNMPGAIGLSARLRKFYLQYGFSFLQNQPASAARSNPP